MMITVWLEGDVLPHSGPAPAGMHGEVPRRILEHWVQAAIKRGGFWMDDSWTNYRHGYPSFIPIFQVRRSTIDNA